MNEITIGDRVYISAKRAAEITGYARDYVGQLCREGHVDAKMVGRSWYVYEPSIRAHRFGAAQAAGAASPMQEEAMPEEPQKDTQEANSEPQEAAETVSEHAEEQHASDASPTSTWEQPIYKAESFSMIPEIAEQPAAEPLTAEESLTDMQSAWKEWFERKQSQLEVPEIESPEVIDARNSAHSAAYIPETQEIAAEEPESEAEEAIEEAAEEVSVPMHRIHEQEEEPVQSRAAVEEAPEPVAIRRTYAEIPQQEPVIAYGGGRVVRERITKRRSQKKGREGSYAPITAALLGLSLISIVVAVIGTGIANRYTTSSFEGNSFIQYLVGTRDW